MMRAFAESAEVRAVFDEASSALGQDLGTLVAPADQPLAPAGDDAATEVHDSPPGPPSQP